MGTCSRTVPLKLEKTDLLGPGLDLEHAAVSEEVVDSEEADSARGGVALLVVEASVGASEAEEDTEVEGTAAAATTVDPVKAVAHPLWLLLPIRSLTLPPLEETKMRSFMCET